MKKINFKSKTFRNFLYIFSLGLLGVFLLTGESGESISTIRISEVVTCL